MRRTLIDYLLKRQNQLETEIRDLEKSLKNAPNGKLRISCNGNRTQFYFKADNESTKERYMKANEFELAKALVQKDYEERELETAKTEKKLIGRLLSFLRERKRVFDLLVPRRKALVKPYDFSDDEYARLWQSIPYEGKSTEGCQVYETERGEKVRSKSEALVANMFFHAGIPYKYEKPLKLRNGKTIHPDFTVLNKRTREVFIFEHFGRMDDEDYRDESFFKRLRDYTESGYVIGVNLIVSFEGIGYGHSLDLDYIKKIIKEYFS